MLKRAVEDRTAHLLGNTLHYGASSHPRLLGVFRANTRHAGIGAQKGGPESLTRAYSQDRAGDLITGCDCVVQSRF